MDEKLEIWQLKWSSAPKPVCGANEVSLSLTCPCMGFAYGEAGDLVLVRVRNGTEVDRLNIAPYFEEQFEGEGRKAIIQRWATDYDRDFKAGLNQDDISEAIAKRRIVQVMHFGDYNHDGWATEFYLQTESAPCGKSVGMVIGVSKGNPRLHVFGTTSKPNKPLYLQRREWEALRDASSPTEVLDWPCGDHGAETETRVRLRWTAGGIEGVRRELTCPEGKEAKQLIREQPL